MELLELFAEFGKISGDGCLAIAGDHPAPSFLHYVQYLLNTRFAGIKDRVILLAEIEDRALMALFSRAAAMIHLGPSGPGLLGDAVHFRKPLFTACGASIGTTGGGSGGYRFYGDDRRGQAARLHSLLKDKDALSGLLDLQRQDHEALKSASDCLSIWPLLELAAACVAAP